jgi:hypothetical protein
MCDDRRTGPAAISRWREGPPHRPRAAEIEALDRRQAGQRGVSAPLGVIAQQIERLMPSRNSGALSGAWNRRPDSFRIA